MNDKNKQVKVLLDQENWHGERKKLRSIILECGLNEEVKWNKLCYCFKNNKVVIFYGLKHYCALGFFKGSLLSDNENLLVMPGKHSQAMRQLRFTGLKEITDSEAIIKNYINRAIQAEKDKLVVEFDEKDNLSFPDELQEYLDSDLALSKAFETLTPGRQRGYVLHFSNAKQSKTRKSRIEKCRSRILDGKGMKDR